MKKSKTILMLCVAAGLSTSAQASVPGLDSLLSRLVTSAISTTTEELNNQVKEAVLNASYHVNDKVTNGKVEITETKKINTKEDE